MPKLSDNDFFSPAGDLTTGMNPGGGSTPAAPSVHPNFDLSGSSGTASPGSKPAENFGEMSETPGEFTGVQLAEAPESPSADLGNQLAGGLGTAPKP